MSVIHRQIWYTINNMKQSRKKFIQSSSLGIFGLLSWQSINALNPSSQDAVIVHASEGETYWIGARNSPLTIKIAKDRHGNNSMSFCTEIIAPGEGIPVHKHLNEDELIFVHTGEGILVADEERISVKTGSVALIPKGCWHSIENTGQDTFTMVFSYSPAGFEGYFREMGSPAGTPWQPKTKEVYEALNKKWGIIYK